MIVSDPRLPHPSHTQVPFEWELLATVGHPRFPIYTCFGWAFGSHRRQHLVPCLCRRADTWSWIERGQRASSPSDWSSMVSTPVSNPSEQ